MREILFKGKKKDNGEWIEGYLLDGGMPGEKRIFIGKLVIGKWTVMADEFDEVDPDTICEYTGLTDKNGKKIWENDIVNINSKKIWKNDIVNTNSNIRVQIKFGLHSNGFSTWKHNQGFYMDFMDKECYRPELGYWAGKSVVIGNIFDNPELLQKRGKKK